MTGRNWVKGVPCGRRHVRPGGGDRTRPPTRPTSTRSPIPFPAASGRILQVLRQALRYAELELVADAALAHEDRPPRRAAAVRASAGGRREPGRRPGALPRAGRGRDAAGGRPPRGPRRGRPLLQGIVSRLRRPGPTADYLLRSLDAYMEAYRADPKPPGTGSTPWRCWPAPNGTARSPPRIAPGGRARRRHSWDRRRRARARHLPEVTACEAAITLGRFDDAVARPRRSSRRGRTDSGWRRFSVRSRGCGSSTPHELAGQRVVPPAALCIAQEPAEVRSRWSPPTSVPHASTVTSAVNGSSGFSEPTGTKG